MGPIAQYARNSGGETQYSKGVENKGHSDSRDASHGSVSYDTEDSEPYCPWEEDHLLESAMGRPTEVGQLLHAHGWGVTHQLLVGSCYSNAIRTRGDTLQMDQDRYR